MRFRSTYARHRIRHDIRHTAALAGRRHRTHVQNERLRHMPNRLRPASSKADGSQSLEVPAERGAVLRRADAAFAKPEIYEALEQRDVDYAIRMPANKSLELDIKDLLFRPVLQQARHGGAMDQGRQAGDPLDAVVVPSVPGERSAPATERTGLQPGQPLAQADPAASDQALVADESPAAAGENRRPAGEARQILLAPAGGRSSGPGGSSATCCGGSGHCRCQEADARPECNEAAKTRHTCGAVPEKYPGSRGSSRFPVERGPS